MSLLLKEERQLVADYGRQLLADGLTRGSSGNISIFRPDKGLYAISPTGVPYEEVKAEDVVIMDLDGQVVDGHYKPSSEHELHRIFYRERDDIKAVVHTHSPACAAYSCLRKTLPPFHYMIAVAGPDVRCADYASYGTHDLAVNAYEAMKDRKAVLLANHGLVAGGANIAEAYNIASELEYMCDIYSIAKTFEDEPVILDQAEMDSMAERFKTYGQPQKL